MDKTILVVEVIKYKNIPTAYNIKKTANSLQQASEYLVSLRNLNDAEIIRTNSTGLVIYNPKNLADRIKGMKNKNVSRKDKILARVEYEKQAQK